MKVRNPRDLMLRARDLSLDLHYRNQLQEFYLLQENAVDALVRCRQTVNSVVDDLKKRADALNHPVMHYFAAHAGSFTAKTVLTMVGVSLPFVLGVNEAAGLLGLIPAGYELVKFSATEVVESKAKCEAAAMVVSAQKVLRRRGPMRRRTK